MAGSSFGKTGMPEEFLPYLNIILPDPELQRRRPELHAMLAQSSFSVVSRNFTQIPKKEPPATVARSSFSVIHMFCSYGRHTGRVQKQVCHFSPGPALENPECIRAVLRRRSAEPLSRHTLDTAHKKAPAGFSAGGALLSSCLPELHAIMTRSPRVSFFFLNAITDERPERRPAS